MSGCEGRKALGAEHPGFLVITGIFKNRGDLEREALTRELKGLGVHWGLSSDDMSFREGHAPQEGVQSRRCLPSTRACESHVLSL